MKQKQLWSVVALSTTVVGIPSVGRAAATNGVPTNEPPAPSADATNVEKSESQTQSLSSRRVITQVHAHNLAGRQAATLYVRNIPFLTFVGQQAGNDNPVERASLIGNKVNQLISDKVDANQITVSWKAGRYTIKVNGAELVELDGNTRLPDTTNNLGNDALQATNRLRRLVGGAQPLNQVSNIAVSPTPVQQPQQAAKKPQQTAKKPQQAAKQPQQTAKQPEVGVQTQPNTRVRSSAGGGMASFYGHDHAGQRTATGERFNPYALTAAHRSLPFGTKVRVTNTRNGRSVIVRINDRGPFIRGRVIDVSLGAAQQLGMVSSGVASVKLEVLD
jgi:rare lipoprotein A